MAARCGCRCRRGGLRHVAVARRQSPTLMAASNITPNWVSQQLSARDRPELQVAVRALHGECATTTAPPGGWGSVLASVRPDAAFLRENRSVRTLTGWAMPRCCCRPAASTSSPTPIFRSGRRQCSLPGLNWQVPLMLAIDELPVIDVVFVSHNHYDHLDAATHPCVQRALSVGGVPWCRSSFGRGFA